MKHDVVIIGGGIVGLATAYKLLTLKPSLKVAVLEKEDAVAKHQSSHNSGVIHSGIYYKPNSLKAINCIAGRKALLEFCNENNIAYELCGKLIVATSQHQIASLDVLYERGVQNGLEGIKKIAANEIKSYEPHAAGLAAIFVPQTGIVNFGQVAKKYAELFQNAGGEIFLKQKVTEIKRKADSSEILTQNKAYDAQIVINCAGLYADKIALLNRKSLDVRIIPFRGEYYKLKDNKKSLVKNLIYPVPDSNFPFLGVHFTRRISGEVEAGPNAVFAFAREGYKKSAFKAGEFFNAIFWRGFQKVALRYFKTGIGEYYRSLNKSAFTKELQKLLPQITSDDLEPAGSGVRAQACTRDGKLVDDFLILEDAHQIDVINAPSPAATASLAIANNIAEMALKRF